MVPSSRPRRVAARRPVAPALVASGAALAVVAASGAAALAQGEAPAFRGIGINKLDTGASVVNTLAIACLTPATNSFVDCVPKGTATIRVTSATKTRLKLRSVILAQAPITAKAAGGEGEDGGRVRFVASSATRKRLKTVRTVDVTVTVRMTSPRVETVTKKIRMTTRTAGLARLLMRSKGDTVDLSGGARG